MGAPLLCRGWSTDICLMKCTVHKIECQANTSENNKPDRGSTSGDGIINVFGII